jgi:uncharacterized caspase-like protein
LVKYIFAITSQVLPSGLFVFYFSGHGKSVADESLLLPADLTYKDDPEYLKLRAVSAKTISDALQASKIRQVLMFLDACRDRLLVTKGAQAEPTSLKFAQGFDLEKLNANVGAFMTFYSTGKDSYSYEDLSAKRSYFTAELVHALDGAEGAYDATNRLTLTGLINYVQARVRSRVEAERQRTQEPDFQLSGFRASEFIVAARSQP